MAGQLTSTTLLQGGLNLVTPAIAVPPGMAIGAVNYEPEVRGYRRIGGYERYDGKPRPSQAGYWTLAFDAGSVEVSAGDVVTGADASAIALSDGVLESGTYAGGDAAGYLVLYNLTGGFVDNENIQVSASTVAVADGVEVVNGSDDDASNTANIRAAIAARRAAIAAVPGIGPVRGVWAFSGAVYAFRDNVGATAGVMHKSTASGWAAQSLGHVVSFSGGTAAWQEGETLTQGGVTATIRRVVLQSGTYSGSDAAGYLTISGIIGGSFSAAAATSASGAGNLTGAEVANALPAGGRYDFTNHNFFGAAERMYGCNGEGEAFEWDGTYFTPIKTGITVDKPTHIAEYSNHLMLGYAEGSLQYSGTGEPLSYTALSGAGEIVFGSAITGLLPAASSALMVFGRNRVSYLAGKDDQDFQLVPLADDAGAVEWTAQVVGNPIYQDDAGVRRMTTTEAFGNWRMGTLTDMVFPIFLAKRQAGVNAIASIRVRAKDQYRIFFEDKSGLTIYVGRKNPEIIPFTYPFQVSCASAGVCDCAVGNEQLYVGGEDGFVYQLDAGTSFDGAEISAFLRLPFNGVGSPMQQKRFHKATLEVDASADTQIAIVSDFSYGNPDLPSGSESSFDVSGGGGFWDAATYGAFYWSSPIQGIAESYINGIGRNISIGILSDATHEEPHVLSSITLNFTYRGLTR